MILHLLTTELRNMQSRTGGRKVLLWSRTPWSDVDALGSESLPPGRYVSGITHISVGELMVIGVCIAWSGSRVRWTGPRHRMWADHEEYLKGISDILQKLPSQRVIIVGDFNQRFGEGGALPKGLRSALLEAVPASMTIATAGVGFRGRRTIDHIALSSYLAVESLSAISNISGEKRLSNHFGVVASVSVKLPHSS